MRKIIYLMPFICLFIACQSVCVKENVLKEVDTIEIIGAALNGREFIKENPGIDTVYFLRNKLFNRSWLKVKSRFKIASLEDNSRSRMANIGLSYPYDSRQRLSVFKFEYKYDTVKVGMYEHGSNLFYKN